MKIAIIENNKVTNIVEGELEVVVKLFDEVAEETEATNIAWIGARWNGEKFEAIKIYDSWTWNESTFDYDPPKPKPEGNFYWDEAELDWLPALEVLEVESEQTEI